MSAVTFLLLHDIISTMKTMKQRKQVNIDKRAEKNKIRSVEQAFREPAPPLSKVQHIISGIAIVIAIIILSVVAISVINWQKQQSSNAQQSVEQSDSDMAEDENSLEQSEDLAASPTSTVTLGKVEAVLPVSLARGNTINVGIDDPLVILNPLYSSGDGEKDLVSLLFDSLITINNDGQPMPELASNWIFDQDNKTLQFTIAAGHFFRDGRSVDSEDVIFTYNCLISDSYNGPYKGKFAEIVDISVGSAENSVIFKFSDSVSEPDYAMFTIGILKRDHYEHASDKVFTMFDERISPEGSGNFELDSLSEETAVVSLRPGYAGNINSIKFERIPSADKYTLLQEGKIDIVRSRWDTRMMIRSKSLQSYSFYVSDSRIESYVLVGRNFSDQSILSTPEHRYAALLVAAGIDVTTEQSRLLRDVKAPLTWYFFEGVDEQVRSKNSEQVELFAERFLDYGIKVIPKSLDWPEMAAKLENDNDFDILLMPAPSNSRLPQGTIMLTKSHSQNNVENANAWPADVSSEAIIISARILQTSIDKNAFPLSSSTAGWTKRLENIRFYDPSLMGGQDNEQITISE